MVIYYLTCADQEEALKISTALLEKKFVACIRRSSVNSSYWWGGQINHDEETLLMMEGVEEKFEEIEKVIDELHSYEEFVLTMVPVLKTTPGVQQWLEETIKG